MLLMMEDVTKVYPGNVRALSDVYLNVPEGDFAFLVGPSGSGKSTLIKLLIRDELPTKGRIYIGGYNVGRMRQHAVPQFRRTMGVVFQDYKLLPKRTVYENIAFALHIHGVMDRATIRERVNTVLDIVGLGDLRDRFPATLSGGEQQRIAMARALVHGPKLVLADEPTGNLDPANAETIMDIFEHINRSGVTILVATHNRAMVDAMRKRVILLRHGEVVRDDEKAGYPKEALQSLAM
jgi:cell division transport system ATP-binding protein